MFEAFDFESVAQIVVFFTPTEVDVRKAVDDLEVFRPNGANAAKVHFG